PRIQKALRTAGEAGWQSQQKIGECEACPVGHSRNGAGAVTAKCEGWIGGNVGICREVRMTVVRAESPLVRSPDPAHVFCGLTFNRIVVTGLHIYSGNGKSVRVDSIGESRTDA